MKTFTIEHAYTALYVYKIEAESEEEAIEKYNQMLENKDDIKANGCEAFIPSDPQIFDPDYWEDEYDVTINDSDIELLSN